MKNPLHLGQMASVLLVAALAGPLVSCSSSNDYNWWDEEEEEVKKTETTTVNVENNDGTESPLSAGSTLGYFVISGDGTSSVSNDYVTVGEGGQSSFSSTETGTYIVYSPYQDNWEDAIQNPPVFQVQSDQSIEENYDASDLMAGTMTVGATTRAAGDDGLSLKHLLAKLYVRVIDDTGLIDFRSDGILRLFQMKDAASVYLADQTVTTLEDSSSDITMFAYERTDRRMTAAAIVAPQTTNKEVDLLELSVGGRVFTYSDQLNLESGQSVALVIRFTRDGLRLDGTSITNWNDVDGETELETEK